MRPIVLFSALALVGDARANTRRVVYADADADGWGDPSVVRYSNSHAAVPGYTHRVGDCDDTDARVHPGAVERCNHRDDDCDGLDDGHDTDVVGGDNWFADRDEDGFGDRAVRMRSCVQPREFVHNPRDCDDGDDTVNPLAFEFCSDGDDDDCNGLVDDCAVSLDDAALVVEASRAESPLAVADMDGDGTGDLVVGSYLYDELGGAVSLVYGPASGSVLLEDAVTVGAMSADDSFGFDVGAGDADGDGFDDLLVGAMHQSPNATYLFLGPVTSDRGPEEADAVLTNRSGDDERLDLLVTGDHDGDGAADIAIGSADDGDSEGAGAVYVAPGATIGRLAVSRSDATYVYDYGGRCCYEVGAAVADLGDVGGDGISDLAIGAPRLNPGGFVFVVEGGSAPGRYAVADVASATMEGDSNLGGSLQAVDYDGDGAMDLIAQDDPTDRPVVVAWLGPFIGSLDDTDATASWEWASAESATSLGDSFAAEDFDGDGETDLIIGAVGNYNGNNAGAVFYQWGIASGVVDVGSLPYVTGAFDGARLGRVVAALPDWNGDDIPELAIEAGWSPDYSHSLIYGFFSGSY
jgi:hypothetical protein